MSAIRNIEEEAKHVNEIFPDIDYLVIIELLKEFPSVDDVIKQIDKGNQSEKWKKSINDKKEISQNQLQQAESNSIQTNNSAISTPKSENQIQSTSAKIDDVQQTDKLNNSKNTFSNAIDNKHDQIPSSEIPVQTEKQNTTHLQTSDFNKETFSSTINPPSTVSFNPNTIQQPSNKQNIRTSHNSSQSNENTIKDKHPILTLPKYLEHVKPNMSRFGSFAGPVNTSSQNTNLPLNYSSSSSTSSLSLYTSPPSSYNSASTKISLSSEENKFESFQLINTKDVTTQLDTYDDQDSSSIDGIGYGVDGMNDLNRDNNGETIHQVKYRNLQNPSYLRYQVNYPLLSTQKMQQFQQKQSKLQQQQIFQQQQQHLMMQMQTPNFQPLNQQQQTQQIFSPQYMPPDPRFMETQTQMISHFNLTMPQQNSQENVVGNK